MPIEAKRDDLARTDAMAMDKDPIPKDLQIVGFVAAALLITILFDDGRGIDGALWLFVKSLPACALGLVIYKAMIRTEFRKPRSWPEWILLYAIGLMIGGPLVALAVHLYGRLSS